MSPEATPFLTPPQVARRFGCKPETVLAWIRSGEIAALNLAQPGTLRPRYRISPQALADFEIRRTVVPRPKGSLPRRGNYPAIKKFV